MSARLVSLLAAALAAVALAPTPAVASLGDEVSAGKAVAAQLQAGKASCTTLTAPRMPELTGEWSRPSAPRTPTECTS